MILFEELFKSSVTGEVEAREAGKGEEERKIGSQSGPEWAGSGGGGNGGQKKSSSQRMGRRWIQWLPAQ